MLEPVFDWVCVVCAHADPFGPVGGRCDRCGGEVVKEPARTQVELVLCGRPPDDYDATLKSAGGACPHCGEFGLEDRYGLAAGGVGSYSVCDACGRFCDSVQDEEGDEYDC